MALEYYIRSGQKLLRCGCTTGTCAALAASGAARLLLTGRIPEKLVLTVPMGLTVEAAPLDWALEEGRARCAVEKDGGDDDGGDQEGEEPEEKQPPQRRLCLFSLHWGVLYCPASRSSSASSPAAYANRYPTAFPAFSASRQTVLGFETVSNIPFWLHGSGKL